MLLFSSVDFFQSTFLKNSFKDTFRESNNQVPKMSMTGFMHGCLSMSVCGEGWGGGLYGGYRFILSIPLFE